MYVNSYLELLEVPELPRRVTYLPSGGQGGGSNLLLGLSDR